MSGHDAKPQRSGSSRKLNIRSLSELKSPSSKDVSKSPTKVISRSRSMSRDSPAKSGGFRTPRPASDTYAPVNHSPPTRHSSSKQFLKSSSSSRVREEDLVGTPSKKHISRAASDMSGYSAASRDSDSSSISSFDDESVPFTDNHFTASTTGTSRESLGSVFDDDSVFSSFSQDSFSIDGDELDTTQ